MEISAGSSYSQLKRAGTNFQRENTAAKIVASLTIGFLLLELPMNIVQLVYGIRSCGISYL